MEQSHVYTMVHLFFVFLTFSI